ncbi:MAG: hypothetical protein D3910_13850, partial [Candidatus Electrothrix sp. ATG2]|nr:hypothetical protein [Candidatus Electrothrix sp. ATG2]
MEQNKKEKTIVEEYKCGTCNYKLKPGEQPDSLPDDWQCPVCKASKDALEKIEPPNEVKPILDKTLPKN